MNTGTAQFSDRVQSYSSAGRLRSASPVRIADPATQAALQEQPGPPITADLATALETLRDALCAAPASRLAVIGEAMDAWAAKNCSATTRADIGRALAIMTAFRIVGPIESIEEGGLPVDTPTRAAVARRMAEYLNRKA